MPFNYWVVQQLDFIHLFAFLKHKQILLFTSLSNSLHGLNILILKFQRNLGIDEVHAIVCVLAHDLREEHKLKSSSG